MGKKKVAFAAGLFPLIAFVPFAYAATPASSQLAQIIKNTNDAPYVQETLSQVEHITYQGQAMTLSTTTNIRAHIVHKAFEEYSTILIKMGNNHIREQVYEKGGTVYVNSGSGWSIQGHLVNASISSLSLAQANAYTNVHKSGSTFTADENPKGFSALITDLTNMVKPAGTTTSSANAKVLAQMFSNAHATTVVYAKAYGRTEREARQTLSLSIVISGQELQALTGQSSPKTVTGSVYGNNGANGPALSLKLNETAVMNYANLAIPVPKGLPKA